MFRHICTQCCSPSRTSKECLMDGESVSAETTAPRAQEGPINRTVLERAISAEPDSATEEPKGPRSAKGQSKMSLGM